MTPEATYRSAQRRQCTGKRRYRDRDEAKRVRQHQAKIVHDDLRIYDCPFCQGVHLTKTKEHGAP
jgi:hypothetical protein